MRFLSVFLVLGVLAAVHGSTSTDEIHNQMVDMLGIDPTKQRQHGPVSHSSKAAGRYMKKLFEKHSQHPGPLEGATIRSFSPRISAKDAAGTLVHFNFSAIPRNEQVLRAELHFHQRGRASGHSLSARMSCASCNKRDSMLDVAKAANQVGAWALFDVTDLVDDNLRSGDGTGKVEFARRNMLINALKVQRVHSAFLVVYSIDSEQYAAKTAKKQRKSATRAKRSLDSYYRYMPVGDVDINDIQFEDDQLMNTVDHEEADFRRRFEKVRQAGPSILQPRLPKKHKRRFDPSDPMMGFGSFTEEDIVSTTAAPTRPHLSSNDVSLYLLGGSVDGKCARRQAAVRFRDIGWDEWIIAPREFDTGFCEGSCSFPLDHEHHPTNHAQLQSILHSLRRADVPDVCCAPQKMDSLTLLYYDENEDVVLKNFPKMVVTSCGCV